MRKRFIVDMGERTARGTWNCRAEHGWQTELGQEGVWGWWREHKEHLGSGAPGGRDPKRRTKLQSKPSWETKKTVAKMAGLYRERAREAKLKAGEV